MDAFVFLLICLIAMIVVVSRVYGGREEPAQEIDRRVDRLVAIVDPDVMEGLTRLVEDSRESEVDLANRLLREAIRKEENPR